MKTIYKVLIAIFVIIILVAIGVILYLFLKPKEKVVVAEEPINQSISIDTYNKIYNMNYGVNRLFANSEITSMDSALATVVDVPVTKNIIVNDKNLVLYIGTITFDMKNYTNIDAPTMKYRNDFMRKTKELLPAKTVIHVTKDKNISTKTIFVTSEIVTTKPIVKGDKFMVYYKYGSEENDKVLPPFLLEEYVSYID